MIEKIQEWLLFKYGVQIESKHIWMILILFSALLLLFIILLIFSGNSSNGLDPNNLPLVVPPGVAQKSK